MPQKSVFSIVTGFGLDGPGIEHRCWRNFPHSSWPDLGSNQPPIPGHSFG